MPMLKEIKQDLLQLANPEKALILRRFFKTGKGEYGEGDKFLGITVPEQRRLAKKYRDMELSDVQKLLRSKIHEYRLTGLFILVDQYERARKRTEWKKTIDRVNFYLVNLKYVNNWDLVDLSAPKILGDYLVDAKKQKLNIEEQKLDIDILYNLAKSKNIWKRRIAILSSFAFIKNCEFEEAIKISRKLLRDKADLIHKAVGWMLREIGKRDKKTEIKYLDKYHRRMPRTMLRYAIEKFSDEERNKYLKVKKIGIQK